MFCDGSLIENCKADGFLNINGAGGTSRVGYGFAPYGTNPVIRGVTATNCKHGIAFAGAARLIRNPVAENCFCQNAIGNTPIDIHSGVVGTSNIINCTSINNSGYSNSPAITIRTGNVNIEGGYYSGGGTIIKSFEQGYLDLSINNVKYELQNSSDAFIKIDSSEPVDVNSLTNVSITNCQSFSTVGSFIYLDRDGTAVDNVFISNNRHTGEHFYYHEGSDVHCFELDIRNNAHRGKAFFTARFDNTSDDSYLNHLHVNDNYHYKYIPSSFSGVSITETNFDSTKINIDYVNILDNTIIHDAVDTGNGYSMGLAGVEGSGVRLESNTVNRGSFRGFNINNINLTGFHLNNNTALGAAQILIQGASALTNGTIIGNVAPDLIVKTTVTLTNIQEGLNAATRGT